MSLNWREIELILSELPLQGSSLQQTIQHDFHSLSWNFYHPEEGRWTLYTEFGTPFSRLHAVNKPITYNQRGKTAKLQRFIQFSRANLEGSKVIEVYQQPFDRLVLLKLDNHGRRLNMYLRFYSGPGANILITDQDDILQDLLYRRPNRNEHSKGIFTLPPVQQEEKVFLVRPRTENSFNLQIEAEYGKNSNEATYEDLVRKVQAKAEKELRILQNTVSSQLKTLRFCEGFDSFRKIADILSANQHLLTTRMESIDLEDWESGKIIHIELDEKQKASANIALYYEKYQKAKGTYENALAEVEKAKKALSEKESHYSDILREDQDRTRAIARLQRELKEGKIQQTVQQKTGLVLHSGEYTLLVGRNAKENDELLRHHVRGNDYWLHTRDYPGGYVFIKYIKNKSVPLDVLLDAANLALIFSKAKSQKKAELYYTQVKYLRRVKEGKTGLVIPTQEKNISVTLDDGRLSRLLLEHANA